MVRIWVRVKVRVRVRIRVGVRIMVRVRVRVRVRIRVRVRVRVRVMHTRNEKVGKSFHAPSHVRLWKCIVDELNYEKNTCKEKVRVCVCVCEVKQKKVHYIMAIIAAKEAGKNIDRPCTSRARSISNSSTEMEGGYFGA
jgi:hypothetical protein